jgi:hypothetical protein
VLISWRKIFQRFPRYRRCRLWCVVALVVSVGFLIADLVYPPEESKPTQTSHVSVPTPEPTPLQLRAQDVEVERPEQPRREVNLKPSARHLPEGVFSADPMDGYGATKTFMGIQCSWNNVDVLDFP